MLENSKEKKKKINLVSVKLSLVVAAAALQLGAARECTARLTTGVRGTTGMTAHYYSLLQVWFNDEADNVLDTHDSDNMTFEPFATKPATLSSDELEHGDVRFLATGNVDIIA